MRLPILYALSAPNRVKTSFPRLNLLEKNNLTFEPPHTQNFPCLSLAIHAAKTGGTLPAVMNFLNEWAVNQFLQNKIKFYEISDIISSAFSIYNVKPISCADDIFEAEAWANEYLKNLGGFTP
jgi:1-deoxy-D-xylulose-5-phosphate reductoisomerase